METLMKRRAVKVGKNDRSSTYAGKKNPVRIEPGTSNNLRELRLKALTESEQIIEGALPLEKKNAGKCVAFGCAITLIYLYDLYLEEYSGFADYCSKRLRISEDKALLILCNFMCLTKVEGTREALELMDPDYYEQSRLMASLLATIIQLDGLMNPEGGATK
jgi:hypothetical protein